MSTTPDPAMTIDISSLRLPDNFTTVQSGIKLPIKPSFGKLSKQRFCRTHPGAEYQFPALLVDDKEGGEFYLATPALAAYLGSMAKSVILRLVVDNAGTPKIIAQPILDALTKTTLWSVTTVEAIRLSETQWIRIESNMEAQQYTIIEAANNLGEPIWPAQTMSELVQTVFVGHIISSEDHPLISQLQGRI